MLDNKTLANKNYVNDRFKTYHSRDANQDELSQFTGKGLFDVDKAIGAGANTAKLPTAPKLPETIDSGILSAGMKTGDISSQLPETTAGIIKETEIANAQIFSEGAKGTLKIYEQQMKDAQANKKIAEDELKKIEADRENQVTDRYEELSQPYRQKMEEEGNAEFELKEKYQKYSELANSLTVYADQAYNDLQAEKNRPSLASVSQGRQSIIKDDYNSKIALTQTAMAALSGDIALGRTFIDRGIEAVTADRNDELNFLNFVNGLFNEKSDDAKANLLTATAEEKSAIQNRITTIESEFTRMDNEKEGVREFLLENSEVAIKADVKLTDSLDEMTNKITDFYEKYPKENADQSTIDAYVNQIKTGKLKLTSVPASIRNEVAVALGDYTTPGGGTNTTVKPEDSMTEALGSVAGEDGYVSPENYQIGRDEWVKAGLNPTIYDTKMKGFRNPNNPYYIVNKATSSTGRSLD